MISRRTLFASAAAAGLSSALPRQVVADPLGEALPTVFVDPLIGTGGHGHVYPGASLPLGMVQLSPDTDNSRWDACSGYYYDDATLLGFSHTHLSGTGASDMLDLLVVPATGDVRLSPGSLANPEGSYRTALSHDHETATPGYYSLVSPESGIRAELTAALRSGLHRYTFPPSVESHLLIDWSHGFRNFHGSPTHISSANIEARGLDTLVGSREVHEWASGRVIYFALKLSQPAQSIVIYSDDKAVSGATSCEGTSLKAVLFFGTSLTAPLLVKVGLSAVDIAGALSNLEADLPTSGNPFDFELTRASAQKAWDVNLACIKVETNNEDDRRIFYTSLYHAHMAPTLFSDADGRYRGMDRQIHTLPTGQRNFSTYSLWDTYRALHPLMTIIKPELAGEFAQDLIGMAELSPSGPCVWPLQGIETHCMTGWHSAAVIAEALAKGLPGVDAERAWAVYKELAFTRDTPGLNFYRKAGYLACDTEDQSVSKTLEYAYDDWAMAHIAFYAGDDAHAELLRIRAQNYYNVFDPKTRFARPRLASGLWAEPFDPASMGHDSKRWWDYTESNAWQATFVNQHDVYGYINLFGGDKAFEAKLDALFTASSVLPADAPPDMSGLIGQYVHGNEPSHHIAYLYAFAGASYKTQLRCRSILRTQYRAGRDGMAGNEDCGQMSAWYILSALGFYPVDPISEVYVFGSPIFPKVEIAVGPGKTLTITAENTADSHPYIESVTLNGSLHTRSWISHAELMRGGELRFVMAASPNREFGRAKKDRPPSYLGLGDRSLVA